MNISCEVIRDLLPLYAEEMLSPESATLVETHLAECPSCTQMLEEMKQPPVSVPEVTSGSLRNFRKRVIQWLVAGVMAALFFAVTLVVWGCGALLRQNLLPVEDAVVSVTEEDGAVYVELSPSAVEGLVRKSYEKDDFGGRQQFLCSTKSFMDGLLSNTGPQETVKLKMHNTTSVWYYDGGKLVCLYGNEEPVLKDWGQDPVLIPALIFGVLVALGAWLLRQKWMGYTAVLAFSFVLANLTVTGGANLYAGNGDWIMGCILLIMAGLLTGSVTMIWEFITGAASKEL